MSNKKAEAIEKLIDKYEYALRQVIPMNIEQTLYADKVLSDMLAETIDIATAELQEIAYHAVLEELKAKGLLKDE